METHMPHRAINLDEKLAMQTLRLLDKLEGLDDIQRVYSNADFPPQALEAYSQES